MSSNKSWLSSAPVKCQRRICSRLRDPAAEFGSSAPGVPAEGKPDRRVPENYKPRRRRYLHGLQLAPALVEEVVEWPDSGAKHVVEFNSKPANCRKSFERLIRLAKLDKHVVRHTLRHTAATWMMQEGVDLAEAAGYLGMSPETLQKRYAHHHPDYQKTAANKLAERANRARTDAKRANDWPMKQGEQT